MQTGWETLRPTKKLPVFELGAREREIGIYPEVLVGDRSIYVGVEGEFAVLSREALSLQRRIEIDGMTPVSEWTNELVLVAGADRVGMFDLRSSRLLWGTTESPFGRQRWRDFLILGGEDQLSIIDPLTGQQAATISASGPGHNAFLVCGDIALVNARPG